MTAHHTGNHKCSLSDCIIPAYLRSSPGVAERCHEFIAATSIESAAPAPGAHVAVNLLPTTLTGTRPTVSIINSRKAREELRQAEAERVASLGFWRRLLYRTIEQRLAD